MKIPPTFVIPRGDNGVPPNFKEITEAEFARSHFFIWDYKAKEYRQLRELALTRAGITGTDFMAIRLYLMHDGIGYGIVSDHSAGKLRFFRFAECEHTKESKTIGNCLTLHTCTKCGYKEVIDSSD